MTDNNINTTTTTTTTTKTEMTPAAMQARVDQLDAQIKALQDQIKPLQDEKNDLSVKLGKQKVGETVDQLKSTGSKLKDDIVEGYHSIFGKKDEK